MKGEPLLRTYFRGNSRLLISIWKDIFEAADAAAAANAGFDAEQESAALAASATPASLPMAQPPELSRRDSTDSLLTPQLASRNITFGAEAAAAAEVGGPSHPIPSHPLPLPSHPIHPTPSHPIPSQIPTPTPIASHLIFTRPTESHPLTPSLLHPVSGATNAPVVEQ
jgi:hypothetical protein